MRHLSICTTLSLAALFAFSFAETYYVTPSASTPCPEEGKPCFTLSQYATKPNKYFASNTTLTLLPGNHTLNSKLWITNIKALTLIVMNTTTHADTFITCSQSARVTLNDVDSVIMRGLVLFGCVNNNITSVKQFTLGYCTLQGQGRNGTGLELNNITSAKIVRSSFSSYTGEMIWDPINQKVGAGGAIIIRNSTITIFGSIFANNTVTKSYEYGGAVYAYSSNVIMTSNIFNSNTATGYNAHGGAVCAKNSNLIMNNNTFKNNTVTGDNGWGGAMYAHSTTMTIHGDTFDNNKVIGNHGWGGAVMVWLSNVTMNGTAFNSNSVTGHDACGGAVYAESSFLTMDINNTFFYNTVTGNESHGTGGALWIYNVTLKSTGFLHIKNNMAGKGGALYASQSTIISLGNTTILKNYGTLYALSCNVTFMGHTNVMNNLYSANTSQEGGAVTGIQSNIVFTGTTNLSYNTAMNGGAISVIQSKLHIYGDFTIAHNTAALSGGGIYMYQSEVNMENHTNITSNSAVEKGGGINAISSIITMKDHSKTYIVGNLAKRGGGAHLEMNAKLYIVKELCECKLKRANPATWIRLEFIENLAEYGGALYISDDTNSGTCQAKPSSGESTIFSECSIQGLTMLPYHTLDIVNINNIYFINNSARKAGDVIYGGLLDRCTVSPYAEIFLKINESDTPNAVPYIINITNLNIQDFNNSTNMISSDPVRVCFCRDNQPDCSYHPRPVYVKKGETFRLSLVAVDQINNTISNSTIHGSVPLHASLGEEQSAQKTNENRTCTDLNYTILSSHNSGELSLYAEGPCMSIGISKANIKIYIEPCPIGFEDNNQRCDCDRILLNKYVSNCSIDGQTVLREDNVWFSYVNTTDHPDSYILHKHCPFDYCLPSAESVHVNLTIPNGADAMCAFNRTRKLCGTCKDSLSLSLGSSRCLPCSNNWLTLLIVFAIAGVVLVAFILVCNLTVAVGTINGLIFYANIIAANRAIFLPFDKPHVLTIFLSWVNLDFGFETCFYNGMDGYAKTWLQFAFPLYIISLVVAIIVMSDYSSKFAALFTRGKDPIATLATLILLSYTKLIRTIITALSFTILEYSNDSTKSYELVWLTDANIPYFKGKHILLFITALVVIIIAMVYTLLLFSWQWINMWCPKIWLTKNSKLNIFMDTYHNPYNKDHRYWIGLLLLVRVLLYLVSAVNALGDPGINTLSITIAVFLLYSFQVAVLQKQNIYKNALLQAIENLSLLNLIAFTSVTYYLREDRKSQAVVAYISTSIAFVTFLVILAYHTCVYVLEKTFQKVKAHFKERDHHAIQSPSPIASYDGDFEEEQVTMTVVDRAEPYDTLSDDDHWGESDEDEEIFEERDTKQGNRDTPHSNPTNTHSKTSNGEYPVVTKSTENTCTCAPALSKISNQSIKTENLMSTLACQTSSQGLNTAWVLSQGENRDWGNTFGDETTPLLEAAVCTKTSTSMRRNYTT